MPHFDQAVQAISSVASRANATTAEALSLDTRMTAELAGRSGAVSARQENLLVMAQFAMSDPQALSRLQANVADFQVQMSVTASMARKAVGAIETLVKS